MKEGKTMKPVIGITPSHSSDLSSYNLNEKYVNAVLEAGGIPIMLPLITNKGAIEKYVSLIDGLLLSGGIDPDPLIWDEEPLPGMGKIDPVRDEFEIDLMKTCLKKSIPILGICRGFQVLNVAFGGSLIQDLSFKKKDYIKHAQDAPRWYPTHLVQLEDNSLVKNIFGTESLKVNSFHHQALASDDLADGFRATAKSSDGIVEAIENVNSDFVIGVQWHPECMWEKDISFLKLFKKFIETAEG
jgi:putative glutamine amidotransferase